VGEQGTSAGAELLDEIVDAILAVNPEWDGIQVFVRRLSDHLAAGRLFVDLNPGSSMRIYVVSVVELGLYSYDPTVFVRAACRALTTVAKPNPGLSAIENLAARLEAQPQEDLRILNDGERAALRIALRPVADLNAGDLSVIVHSMGRAVPLAAEDADTLDALLQVLEEAATSRGKAPALILFVATLADRKPQVYDDVWGWIDKCAPRLAIEATQLDHLRGKGKPTAAAEPRRLRVALSVVDEKPYSSTGRYHMSRWLRWDDGRISNKRDDGVLRSMEELCPGGERMLAEFHEVMRSADADVVDVEFFLPGSALNLKVDMWRVGDGALAPRVGLLSLVVIHSSERVNSGLFHAAWKERWQALKQSHDGDSVRWLRWVDEIPSTGDLIPQTRDHTAVLAALADSRALGCLGLHDGEEPDVLAMQVSAAIQVGVPAIIWRRDGGDVTQVRTLLSDLAASGRLLELPAEIVSLRRCAASNATHPGQHLSLIWDNYDERDALIASLQYPSEA
jgi:hypothetical protein